MLITRPYSPRLISRSPSRISIPMLRLDLAIFDLLSNLPQNMSRDVLSHILRVHRQHQDYALLEPGIVDHAITATFPRPGARQRTLRSPPEPGMCLNEA